MVFFYKIVSVAKMIGVTSMVILSIELFELAQLNQIQIF
jgi:hypothetical protein